MNRTGLCVAVFAVLPVLSAPASAQTVIPAAAKPAAACLDPQKSYVARPLSSHDAFAQQSIDAPKPAVRITTSCHQLDAAIAIRFSSAYSCIGLGDRVGANENGHAESCIVTGVKLYAPQDGDLPAKK